MNMTVSALGSVRVLFSRVSLNGISASVAVGTPTSMLLTVCVTITRGRNMPTSRLHNAVRGSVLGRCTTHKACVFPIGPSVHLVAGVFRCYSRGMPG